MGLLGRIFGTDKAILEAVKTAKTGMDYLVYTDQEKAEAAAQERTEGRKMVVEWMRNTQGQNLARRFIAISVVCVWLTQIVIGQILLLFSVFLTFPENIMKAAGVMQEGAGDMEPSMMLVMTFYFAAPHMGAMAKAITGRFAKKAGQVKP